MDEEADLRAELNEARDLIANQAVRIDQLEQAAARGSGLDALRELLQLSDIVGITVGRGRYREMFAGSVQACRQLLRADAASLLLLDHETNELVFEAASGGADVVAMRIPAQQGIAGWVMMTGEPIATADVRQDPRWNRSIAEQTGYVPKSIIAAPILVRDEVEGVVEVLDKSDGGAFSMDDMQQLLLFARPIAIAVEQARIVGSLGQVLVNELGSLANERGSAILAQAADYALAESWTSADQTVGLARMVHDISRKGERARQLAIEILSTVARYT